MYDPHEVMNLITQLFSTCSSAHPFFFIFSGNSFRSQSEPEADIFAKFGNTTQKDNINANLLAARQLDDILNQLSVCSFRFYL